jgi:hypothetical protein
MNGMVVESPSDPHHPDSGGVVHTGVHPGDRTARVEPRRSYLRRQARGAVAGQRDGRLLCGHRSQQPRRLRRRPCRAVRRVRRAGADLAQWGVRQREDPVKRLLRWHPGIPRFLSNRAGGRGS